MSENAPTRSLDDIDLAALRVSIHTVLPGWLHPPASKVLTCDMTTAIKRQRNKVVRIASPGLLFSEKPGRCFHLCVQKPTCCPFCASFFHCTQVNFSLERFSFALNSVLKKSIAFKFIRKRKKKKFWGL